MTRNRTAAMLLNSTLGFLGIHSFYLGKQTQGILYILAFTVGWILLAIPPIIAIIALVVEFYNLLKMTDEEFAQKYGLENKVETKTPLAAGVLAIVGGIWGMHFSYQNHSKAATNRFWLGILAMIAFVIGYAVLMTMVGFTSFENMSTENFDTSKMLTGYLIYLVSLIPLIALSIKTYIEAYNLFKQEKLS